MQIDRVEDPKVQRGLEEARDTARAIQAQTIGGSDVEVRFAAAANTTFPHPLGRRPVGWFVTDATGGTPMLSRVAWDAREITLYHAGGFIVTCRLRVF